VWQLVVATGEVELSGQELLNYISKFVQVEYIQVDCLDGSRRRVDQNMHVDAGSSLCRIRLTNSGQRTIIGGNWSIYFNHAGNCETPWNGDQANVTVCNVDGWLFTLTLRPGLHLRPLSNIIVPTPIQLPSRSYAFPRWYDTRHYYYYEAASYIQHENAACCLLLVTTTSPAKAAELTKMLFGIGL